jgi:hypothetical protein
MWGLAVGICTKTIHQCILWQQSATS